VTAAALLGASGAVLDLPRTTLTVLAAALGALVVVFDLARWRHRDAGAWQRQIDREFRLRIAGTTISVLRNEAIQVEFEWRDVVEIQSLSRRGTFPAARAAVHLCASRVSRAGRRDRSGAGGVRSCDLDVAEGRSLSQARALGSRLVTDF